MTLDMPSTESLFHSTVSCGGCELASRQVIARDILTEVFAALPLGLQMLVRIASWDDDRTGVERLWRGPNCSGTPQIPRNRLPQNRAAHRPRQYSSSETAPAIRW